MKLLNMEISDADVPDKINVLDAIHELATIIKDNYESWNSQHVWLEFNIGTRIGQTRHFLVVFCDIALPYNPYVLHLSRDSQGQSLTTSASLDIFSNLADREIRRETNRGISVGFKRLPHYAFLSEQQIIQARNLLR